MLNILSSASRDLDHDGLAAARNPDSFFHIISKDTGFDPLIKFLKEKKGIFADRVKSIEDIPLVKIATSTSLPQRLSVIVKRLHQMKAGKPRTPKTLGSTINAAFQKKLSPEDVAWMTSFPAYLCVEPGYLVVHAGFEASTHYTSQSLDRVCRIQYVDKDTGDYKSGNTPREVPPNSERWMEAWPGPETVVYGHAVHSKVSPHIVNSRHNARTIGLDTGCVFGGYLTALVLDPDRDKTRYDDGLKFHKVKAFKTYFEDRSRGQPGED